jgi:ribosome biogenesis GTPase
MDDEISLAQLGWQPFFQQQLSLDEYQPEQIARIIGHHRSEYLLRTEREVIHLPVTHSLPTMTLGDWLLLNTQHAFIRLLERKSLFSRKAAGNKVAEQLIAANIDTLFIVCSLNYDFNLSRIERYLAVANEAQVQPVVVLTKQDLCSDTLEKYKQVQNLDPLLMIETINALEHSDCEKLIGWCKTGQTVALLGSSGVGKSTLINTLIGDQTQKTATIREDDSKGRHTTTARSMHFLPSGGILIDSPGMRELQLAECEDGVRHTFADIEALAKKCKFADCRHINEPGCAVLHAIETGELPVRRLANFHKLLAEQARNAASLQERHAKDKQFGKMVKSVGAEHRLAKKGY